MLGLKKINWKSHYGSSYWWAGQFIGFEKNKTKNELYRFGVIVRPLWMYCTCVCYFCSILIDFVYICCDSSFLSQMIYCWRRVKWLICIFVLCVDFFKWVDFFCVRVIFFFSHMNCFYTFVLKKDYFFFFFSVSLFKTFLPTSTLYHWKDNLPIILRC